jgi:hypothetical protein
MNFFEKYQKLIIVFLIVVASIYLITALERMISKEDNSTELLIEHAAEKAQMKTKIDLLENKVHSYELEILKIRTEVVDMSDDQLDSTWSAIFEN